MTGATWCWWTWKRKHMEHNIHNNDNSIFTLYCILTNTRCICPRFDFYATYNSNSPMNSKASLAQLSQDHLGDLTWPAWPMTPMNPKWIDMVGWIGLRGSRLTAKLLQFTVVSCSPSHLHPIPKRQTEQVLFLVLSTPSWNVLVEHDIFSKGWNCIMVKSKALCARNHLPKHNCNRPYMHPVIQVSFCHHRNKTFLSGFRWNKKRIF